MDRITKSHLSEFRNLQSFRDDIAEDTLFEHFTNYCFFTKLYDEEIEITSLHTGGGDDLGIDGIAILVNGTLVESPEDIYNLIEQNKTLDVTFFFNQAKTSSGFQGEQIATFLDGVESFFSEERPESMNEAISNARAIMDCIYDNSVHFANRKPNLELNFSTTGEWKDPKQITGRVKKHLDRLDDLKYFSHINFHPNGAQEVQEAYRASKNNVTSQFIFSNKCTVPEMSGVSEAYLGTVPATEYLKLITDEAGNIRKQLFYDNIRDFQGNNPVNEKIRRTLEDATESERLVLLNNGVTIVTRSLQTVGNKFIVTDYQIVNGCQTSHVLFNANSSLGENVSIPLKVISTDNEDLIGQVIEATNSQTAVSADDLLAMGRFQKKVENHFASFEGKGALFYERRSKQYAKSPNIEKVRIVPRQQLARTFAATFLDDAHRATGYYSDLRSQIGDKIFNDEHKLEPYYSAAYAWYRLEYLFRKGDIPVNLKPARYHLLMAARHLAMGSQVPSLTANKIERACAAYNEILWDDEACLEIFLRAAEIINSALGHDVLTRELAKKSSFTDAVKEAVITALRS